jgi:hypothetical protein
LIDNGIIEYWDQFKTKGMRIGGELSSNNRIGVFTVKSENRNDLLKKIDFALQKIEVYDLDGIPIMRKDIYELSSSVK